MPSQIKHKLLRLPGLDPQKMNHLLRKTDFCLHFHWFQAEVAETVGGVEVEGEWGGLQVAL